jgi:CRISPR-associated protein Csm1
MTDNKRAEVYLAALLHDIGKFYQRADENNAHRSKRLSESTKNLESVICPTIHGSYTHKHVLWTAQFFDDFKKLFSGILTSFNVDEMMRLSSAHHNPWADNLFERIIQKADHYSSGADRSVVVEAWKDAEEEIDKNWDAYKRIRMRSVFEGIGKTEEGWRYKLPLKEMAIDESYFPALDDKTNPDYSVLWSKFTKDCELTKTGNIESFLGTLLNILEKHTSRIPGSTIHLPDVSLFDHLKTTAAFALALYDWLKDTKQLKPEAIKELSEAKPFALVGADLSGIQKFIYGISGKGAARNLKGRSFYLQLLVDNIVNRLLKKLCLYDANVVYSSGGGFYIIAPNTGSLPELIEDFEKEITDLLFRYHKTDLYLALDFMPFGEKELFVKLDSKHQPLHDTISDVWRKLGEKISLKKSQRFKNKLVDDFDLFFTDTKEKVGLSKKDVITGDELDKDFVLLDRSDPASHVNRYTYQQIELGKNLKKADFWIQSDKELPYFNRDAFNPIGLGVYNYFISEKERNKQKLMLSASADSIRSYRINHADFMIDTIQGSNNIHGFTFYGGNDYPTDGFHEDSPKTFEELAGIVFTDESKSERKSSPNLSRIGILRMDVDNLGAVFIHGFPPEKRSFSRYSTLSRSLDYFFKGYINEIWESEKSFTENTQIIYSGGDDLFIVGKWDVLTAMAEEINQKFRDWTCHNKLFTLSGGIAVVPPKFPVLKASILAEKEEKNAKSHLCGQIEKNAFSLFGFGFNWDTELQKVNDLKVQIIELSDADHDLAKGFSSMVNNLSEQAGFLFNNFTNTYEITNHKAIWLLAYNFKRAIERYDSPFVKEFLNHWAEKVFTGRIDEIDPTRYHPLQLLAIASRYASYIKRSLLTSK